MEEGLRKLYTGDFNRMEQRRLPDGSIQIKLSSVNYPEVYCFKVRDLYGEHEQLLDHEVTHPGPPEWLIQRMKEAREHGKSD